MVTQKHPRRLGALATLALVLTTSWSALADEHEPAEVDRNEAAASDEASASQPDEPGTDEPGGDEPEGDEPEGDAGDDASSEAPLPADEEPAPAASSSPDDDGEPAARIHHAPVAVATVGEPLELLVDVEHPERVKGMVLVYRAGKEGFREQPFRWGEGGYLAVIPAEEVQAPALAYAIEIESEGGKRTAAFASRAAPHAVQVPEDGMDLIEEALLERLDGRRSVFSSSGEYVSFGKSMASYVSSTGELRETEVDDSYYRIEGGYSYRPLRVVSEFSIRVGVVRGRAPVPVRELVAGQTEDERFDVGLNYGATTVRFRLGEIWHIDGSFLANITEVGFSAGTGGALHIGDVYGSQLVLGFEAIQTFGSRFYSQVDIQAHERVRVSPIVEVTNMPSADSFGVRLLGEVGVNIGAGFAAAARGGYQARDSVSGGPAAGGAISYAF